MHEHGMMRDALQRAEVVALQHGGRLSGVSIRLGANSGITVAAARAHAAAIADQWWGFVPALDVVVGEDPYEPGAHGVTLVSIRTVG